VVIVGGRSHGVRFTEEQVLELERVRSDLGLTFENIHKKWETSAAGTAQRKLQGNLSITSKQAKSLYEILKADPRVEFLKDIEVPDHTLSHKAWTDLYNLYSARLKNTYLKLSFSSRGEIIEGLEKMIQQYDASKE
jgi:hypothetical protein